MKLFTSLLVLLFAYNAHAAPTTACTSFNTQARVAREAVKSLISMAAVPPVAVYFGGVQEDVGGITLVNVQPYFATYKDWYKVSVRNEDCRVLQVLLFAEKLHF
ncbi:hypothetical protein [Bdellovibrio sp. HCB337]|uniref:hypothetical protein n=1 Tax=Bdellovibrio sp. HCB337 TaxID=3394358 RepID=UPI0039A485DE